MSRRITRRAAMKTATVGGLGVAGTSLLAATAAAQPQPNPATAVPLGAIIDWYRFDQVTAPPAGFAICDGSTVQVGPYKGKQLPNLIDRFTMGVPLGDRVGEAKGRSDIPKDGAHTHPNSSTSGANVAQDQAQQYRYNDGNQKNHSHGLNINSDGTHDHGGVNLPPYIGVVKLMRIS